MALGTCKCAVSYLSLNGDLVMLLVAQRTVPLVRVVEHDRDRGPGDARLPVLVHELLEVVRPHVAQVGDAEQEADRVQDVGLARPVEAGDGVEAGVEAADLGPRAVRLEAVDDHLLDEHGGGGGFGGGLDEDVVVATVGGLFDSRFVA